MTVYSLGALRTTTMSKAERKYLRHVRACLLCPQKTKNILVAKIKASLDEQYSDRQEMSYDDFVSTFGLPEEIAKSYLASEDISSVLHTWRKSRRILLSAYLLALTALLIWASMLTISLSSANLQKDQYIEYQIFETEEYYKLPEE